MRKLSLEEIADWQPSQEDFLYGKMLIMSENHNPRSLPRLYSTLLYSILSIKEQFGIHSKLFNEFLCENLFEPEEILRREQDVKKILSKYGNGNKKLGPIITSSKAWIEIDVVSRILNDPERKFGKELREEMVEKMFGVGYKLASLSLRMAWYENLVVVDTNTKDFVDSRGIVYQKPLTSGKPQGIKKIPYLKYENKISEYADNFGVTPALMQATIYAKLSTWKKDSGAENMIGLYRQYENYLLVS